MVNDVANPRRPRALDTTQPTLDKPAYDEVRVPLLADLIRGPCELSTTAWHVCLASRIEGGNHTDAATSPAGQIGRAHV